MGVNVQGPPRSYPMTACGCQCEERQQFSAMLGGSIGGSRRGRALLEGAQASCGRGGLLGDERHACVCRRCHGMIDDLIVTDL